jgi:peptide/nickel transport system substrate-binding protein
VRRRALWAGGVFLAGVLALLGRAGVSAQPQAELRVALPWTPENLDPTMNLSSIRAAVGVSLFDSLVGRDGENRIVPQLAESWKRLDDTTWQFKLRKGVVFHDGEPFNAEAVRFTIQRVLDPNQKSPNRANLGEISRVDVLDDSTVNLVTQRPYAPLLNRLIDFPIVPARYTADKGDKALALRPVGTGPFKFVELVKDDHLIVEAFDRHWRGVPKLRRIVFKPIPEPFTRAAALRNNEVDLITTVPPNSGPRARASARHPRPPGAEHVDHLSRAQRVETAVVRRASAPGAELRQRRGRSGEKCAGRQRTSARGALHATDVRLRREPEGLQP